MAVIYSYPVKSTPELTDKMLISDGTDNLTKQVTISGVKDTIDVVDSLAATLPIEVSASSGAITVSSRAYAGAATTGYVPTGGSNTTFLRGDGTWVTPAGGGAANAAGADTQVQYNDGGTNFGAGAFFTTNKSNKVDIAYELGLKGDGGSNQGLLKLYCESGTAHHVGIKGPNHTGGTPASYTIQLPNSLPNVANQILESNASGTLSWIATPSGGGGNVNQVTAGGIIPASSGAPLLVVPNTGNVVVTSARYAGGSNEGHVPLGGSNTTFLRGDATWATPTNSTDIILTTTGTSGASTWNGTTLNIPQYSGGGISFSGSTANGIATYSSATQANVSSVFTVSGNKLSAPAGTLADPSIEVGAIGGLYAASGGILLAHNGANAIGVTSSSTVNYKLTQFNAGLKFGATGETLNSYEEGTWTPTSANANSISSVSGDYTRIGDMVFAQFSFTMTGSTTVAISGLPFQGVYTSSLKGGVIISADNCTSVQGQLKGGQFTGSNSFTFNSYFGSGGGLPTQLRQVTASMYQTSGGTYAGIIIYETTA